MRRSSATEIAQPTRPETTKMSDHLAGRRCVGQQALDGIAEGVLLDVTVLAEFGPLRRRAAGPVQGRDRRPRQRLAGGGGAQHGADVLRNPSTCGRAAR